MNTRTRSARANKVQVKNAELSKASDEFLIESNEDELQADDPRDEDYGKPKTKSVVKKKQEPKTSKREVKSRAMKPDNEKSLKQETKKFEDKLDEEHEDQSYGELSEKEMKEINHAFDRNCLDGEEMLENDGLRTAIRSLGFEPRGDEIQKLLKKFATKRGKVNRDGFHKIMAHKYGAALGLSYDNSPNDEISRVFNLLDLDKSGYITVENLKSIAKELNEELSEEELREMILEADADGDERIDKNDFQNIMKKTNLY